MAAERCRRRRSARHRGRAQPEHPRARFFGAFTFKTCGPLAALPPWALRGLPSSAHPREGDTLDLDCQRPPALPFGQRLRPLAISLRRDFWATEALHHLAICAYNRCVLLQRRLGQLEKSELGTLRWRLFARAAVGSRARGKPTLKLAVRGDEARSGWRQILEKLTAPPNCHAVESLAA